jgi:hypothetical protein
MLTAGLLAVGGAAGAFWAAYGDGAGAAATGAVVGVSLSPAAPTAQLYPGGTADVVLTISNPNRAAVRLASLSLDTATGTAGFSADAGHGACDLSSLSFTTASNDGAGWTVQGAVGGAAGTTAVTLLDAVAMDVDAPEGCQGVVLTVHLAARP